MRCCNNCESCGITYRNQLQATYATYVYPSYFRSTDIDECLTSTHDCHSNADCINNNGSFSCACMSGYTGNGVNCEGVK